MDDHAQEEEQEDLPVGGTDLEDIDIPRRTDASHHGLGRAPCRLVGLGRIEVAACTEEETGEGDEGEGDEDGPGTFEPGQTSLTHVGAEGMVEKQTHPGTDGDEEQEAEDEVPPGTGSQEGECPDKEADGGGEQGTEEEPHVAPELEDDHAHSIQATPDDEVHAGPMPHTTQEHGNHGVEVGIDLLATFGETDGSEENHAHHDEDTQCNPRIARKDEGRSREQTHPEVSAEGDAAVATKGNVEVGLEPAREGDVPAFPEPGATGGLVGRVEVGRKMETHEERKADGYVSIAREVGIDLEGIDKESHEVLKAREEVGIVEDTIDEIHGKVVAQDDFLEQTIHNPEDGDAEHTAGEEVAAVELGDEVAGLDDGTCHELGEEADIETEIKEVADRTDKSLIDICRIADGLEGEEGDADRQDDVVHTERLSAQESVAQVSQHIIGHELRTEEVVDDIGEEIGILEIAQDGKVSEDTQHKPGTAFPPRGAAVDGLGYEEVAAGDEDKEADEEAAGLVVEEQTDEEEVGVAQQVTVAHEGEPGKDQGEESPELELGEEQRTLGMESEDVLQVSEEGVN